MAIDSVKRPLHRRFVPNGSPTQVDETGNFSPDVTVVYECDFRGCERDLRLEAVGFVRNHPPVPRQPHVKISMPDPAYRTVEGEPAGFGYFSHMVRTQDGTIVAVLSERAESRDHTGHRSHRTITRRSKDGGLTWDDPVELMVSPMYVLPVADGATWFQPVDRNGKIHLPRSFDHGRTLNLDAVVPNQGQPHLQMTNGEIILLGSLSPEAKPYRPDDPSTQQALISKRPYYYLGLRATLKTQRPDRSPILWKWKLDAHP